VSGARTLVDLFVSEIEKEHKKVAVKTEGKWRRGTYAGQYVNDAYPDVCIDGLGRAWVICPTLHVRGQAWQVPVDLRGTWKTLKSAQGTVESYYAGVVPTMAQVTAQATLNPFTGASAECIEPRFLGLDPKVNDELWMYKDTHDPVKLLFVSDQWVVVEKITGQQLTVTRPDFHQCFERSAFKVRVQGYVWCDACGCVHEQPPSDDRDCTPDEWRIVYTDSFDPHETFD
jgi:hypothetical protein